MGNPHAVFSVNNLDTQEIQRLGEALQDHPNFPNRVNAGFMRVIDRGEIELRVYERGVGETLACGTGACAAVVIGQLWGLLDSRVVCHLRGGDLSVEWDGGNNDSVWMTGPATYVYRGEIKQ